ncbi:Rab5-interacting family protein [Pycnococcus provasolii]
MGVPKTAVMSAIDSAEGTLARLTAPRTQGLKYTLSFALRQAEENVRTILVSAKAAVPPKKEEKQEPKEETKKRGADGGAGGGGGKSTRPKWAEDLAKEMKAMASTASQAGSTMPAQTHERRIGGVKGPSTSSANLEGPESLARSTQKLLRASQDWNKDELLDVLHWSRQVLGVVLGVVWATLALDGFFAFVAYAIGSTACIIALYGGHLKLDADDFGGHNALVTEGFAPATALFVVTWTVVHTTFNVQQAA